MGLDVLTKLQKGCQGEFGEFGEFNQRYARENSRQEEVGVDRGNLELGSAVQTHQTRQTHHHVAF
jgi:hypothetical protein